MTNDASDAVQARTGMAVLLRWSSPASCFLQARHQRCRRTAAASVTTVNLLLMAAAYQHHQAVLYVG